MIHMVLTNGVLMEFVQNWGWKINLLGGASNESSVIVHKQDLSHQLENISYTSGVSRHYCGGQESSFIHNSDS